MTFRPALTGFHCTSKSDFSMMADTAGSITRIRNALKFCRHDASCRQNFKALRIRVIEPAVSAIIEKSDLLVQWKPVKAGRKVIGLEFHFQPNPQINLPL